MGTLYLVRHGQASFGAANYDQLSELGARQCRALGEWFAERDVQFDTALRGSLQRHRQSFAALAEGHGAVPDALEWPGLDEYDSEALVHAIHPEPLPPATTPEAFRHHFRLLREALTRWMAGETAPRGMPAYADWVAGIQAALDHVRQSSRGDALIVSSGGPISTAVARLLGAPPTSAIDLNWQIRNSAVTEFHFTPERHVLVCWNHIPHLHAPERRDWATRT